MVGAVHRGVDGRGRERGPRHQLVPRAELALGRYVVGLREAGTPSGVGLGDRDEADLVGVVECVASVGVEATSTGADHDELERLAHRPARRTSTTTIAMKISPINSVSSVTANSGVPGLNTTNSPTAPSTINTPHPNAARPASGDNMGLTAPPVRFADVAGPLTKW